MEKRNLFLPILLIVLSIASLTISAFIVFKAFSKPSEPKELPAPTQSETPAATNTCVEKSSLNCAEETELSYECTKEYQTWALANCPGWAPEGQFCGGFAGTLCPEGYECQLEGDYPDASGVCIKE